MSPNADATRDKTLGTDRRTDSKPGRYVVIDTHAGRQHARGLTQAHAETLAAEYAEGIEARRERPDPHWIQRGVNA
jgi:23S rRNA A2030 N6-methylase RlmJ